MKKRSIQKRSKRNTSSPIFGIYPIGWVVLLVLLVTFSFVVFLVIYDTTIPPRVETIIAEISDLWIEEIQDDSGGYRIYRIRLKQGDQEFTCQLSPIVTRKLHQLEVNKSYKFSVSKTRSRCFVTEAISIDLQNP